MLLFVKRYLFAKKSHSVVNFITTLSLVAISLPVAAVIILLSVFNGFGELALTTNRLVDPDIMVVRERGHFFAIDSLDLEAIAAIEGVKELSAVSEQTMLFEREGRQVVAVLRGVDSLFLDVVPFEGSITKGQYQVSLGQLDRIVLSNNLAYRLGVNSMIDCFVELYALKGSGFSSLLPMSNYRRQRIKLSALYSADAESENRYAITSLRAVQELTGTQGKASGLFIALEQGASQRRTMEELRRVVGDGFRVKNRYDLNPMLYDIIAYEKWGLLFISILIMVIASFSLIGALSILIIEKRSNIATLRAMGGSWRFIRNIFLGEGLLISGVGVALGVIVGCTITLGQKWFGWVKIPSQSFLSNVYPVELHAFDVLIVVVISLLISALLSYIVVKEMIKKE